jgi:hypothetical protein
MGSVLGQSGAQTITLHLARRRRSACHTAFDFATKSSAFAVACRLTRVQGEWPFWPAYVHKVRKSRVEVVFYDEMNQVGLEKMDIHFKGPQKGQQNAQILPYAPYRSA